MTNPHAPAQRPREFELFGSGLSGSWLVRKAPPVGDDDQYVHVVEASALEQCERERDELKDKLHIERSLSGATTHAWQIAHDQRDALLSLCDELASEVRKVLPRAPSMDGKASWTQCQRIVDRVLEHYAAKRKSIVGTEEK